MNDEAEEKDVFDEDSVDLLEDGDSDSFEYE